MKRVKVEKAIGKPLAHDIIKYGPKTKTTLFKRGHEIERGDVKKLKDSGNSYVYVGEGEERGIHEDEAALRMAEASVGRNLTATRPEKGRVRIVSLIPGLLKSKDLAIKEVNLKGPFVFAFVGNEVGVKRGDEVASVKIIPIAVGENQLQEVERILKKNEPVLEVIPSKVNRIGLIITGTEVYEGRIEDAFEPIIKSKLNEYGLNIDETSILPDEKDRIREKIMEFEKGGFDLILITGGMAVDSEDVTRAAIKETGAKVISRGVPVFPGNMLMVAQLKNSTLLGVPACVLPDERTSFDLVLPKVLAGEKLKKEDLAGLAEGGLL